jgi:solute carrier family 25 thiamine pyrophosphate transporter 19
LSLTFTNSQFFWFEFFTRVEHEIRPGRDKSDREKMLVHFICGGLAACISVLTNQPMDTIRTRLVTQGEPRVYSGIVDALRKIYAREGFRAYYRGLVPSLFLVAPETAFRFGIYKFLNTNWSIHIANSVSSETLGSSSTDEIGFLQSSINGSIAGVCAKTLVYPFDLAKKRLQIQGFEEARINFGSVSIFSVRSELMMMMILN